MNSANVTASRAEEESVIQNVGQIDRSFQRNVPSFYLEEIHLREVSLPSHVA